MRSLPDEQRLRGKGVGAYGGPAPGAAAIDILYDGRTFHELSAPFIEYVLVHKAIHALSMQLRALSLSIFYLH